MAIVTTSQSIRKLGVWRDVYRLGGVGGLARQSWGGLFFARQAVLVVGAVPKV